MLPKDLIGKQSHSIMIGEPFLNQSSICSRLEASGHVLGIAAGAAQRTTSLSKGTSALDIAEISQPTVISKGAINRRVTSFVMWTKHTTLKKILHIT